MTNSELRRYLGRHGEPPRALTAAGARRRRWVAPAAAVLFIVLFFGGLASSGNLDVGRAILSIFMRGIEQTSGTLAPVSPPTSAIPPNAAPVVQGQLAPAPALSRPEFEEASVRPCDPDNLPPTPQGARGGGANSFQMTPGRTYALCMTLATLIRTAYGYSLFDDVLLSRDGRGANLAFGNIYGLGAENGRRVRGGPDWVRSDRYTIEAVGDATASAATMQREMLLALLERRFQLKAHIESEQVPAFALTVASGGLKVRPMEAGGCDVPPPTPGMPNQFAPRRSPADIRGGARPWCGISIVRDGADHLLMAGGMTLEAVGSLLGATMGGVQVLNRTGSDDRFNVVLEFAVDDNAPGFGGRGRAAAAADPPGLPRSPTIFTAIEEQLGLRLEPAQAPREFVVIDQVERPAPN